MTNPVFKELTFNVLVEECGDHYVAHCLETGTVAIASQDFDAMSKMAKMLMRQVEFAITNNRLGDIYHPAPREVWDKYLRIKEPAFARSSKTIRSKTPLFSGIMMNQNNYAAVC